MMLQVIVYASAVAAVLSVVGICAERLARLHRLPGRAVWAAAMLLSVLLPAAMILLARPAEIRNVPVTVADQDAPYINSGPADFADSPAAQLPSASVAPRSTWNLPRPSDRLLVTMWMAASSALALYLLGANLLLRRRMKGWHSATVQDHQVLISEVTGPALLGAFSPRIVVPRWLLLQPQGTQRLILQHEQQHVLARDALLIMAGLVAIVAVPWNLPLWWQWRRLRQAIELDCDARVLRAGAEANSYAEVLLAVTQRSRRVPAGALAMSEPVHALERRIANLLPDATRYARLQAIAVLLLAAAGAGAALALEAPALPGRTGATPTAPQGASTPVPRAVAPAPAVQTQAPAQPATEPASLKEGEFITAAVTRGDIEDLVTSTGTLMPGDSADVGAQVSGRIEKVNVEVGDRVRQGDVLAEIDATTAIAKVDGLRTQVLIAEINLETQESNLEKAGRDYMRLENLPVAGATTEEARLDAEAAVKNAERSVIAARAQIEALKANLRIEERNLGYTKIIAPIGGTVMKVQIKQGQWVDATQNVPVMQIANLSTMTMVAEVSEVDVIRLYNGMAAYFTTLGLLNSSRRWYGELKRIEPRPKLRNGVVVFPVLFDVQNDRTSLMPEMTAQVYFVIAEARNVLRVPMAALQQGGTQRRNGTVMVKKADGTLEARQVVVGVTDRVHGEVLEGLTEGEVVVVGKREAEAAAALPVK